MYPQIIVVLCVITSLISVDYVTCQRNFFRQNNFQQNNFFLKQNGSDTRSNQESNLETFCLTNKDKFVCQAYDCNEENNGDELSNKIAKLKCIVKICRINPTEPVCQELKKCSTRKDSEGFFAYIKCVTILFSDNQIFTSDTIM